MNHKVLPINDEEELKKENISIESSLNEFSANFDKLIILEEKIENEILKLDKLYNDIDDNITKFFNIQKDKLAIEENSLKDNLKNEVTKTKEKLENVLSITKELSRSCEKINKGIKLLDKEEKNMKIILSYVSKINKNKKDMKKIINESMTNIKIAFDKERKDIKFNEYIFNRSPPRDIQITDIYTNSFQVSWKLDEIDGNNLNKNQNIFRVEIRKGDPNEKFVQVYEGKENKCQINNLNSDTNYDLRICCVENKIIISDWTEIKKIKTIKLNLNVDSIILEGSGKKDVFLKKIYSWCGFENMELLYRGTRDGMTASKFHQKCDNQGPTICLYQNDKGNIFGGYSSISWASQGGYVIDQNTFLFTLSNIYNTEPTKFKSKKENNKVYHSNERGPTFGSNQDIWIPPDFINRKSEVINFPKSYDDSIGKGKSIFTGDFNNNEGYFKMKEIEVFKLTLIK